MLCTLSSNFTSGVFAPLPCEQCQRGDGVMWFNCPWAGAHRALEAQQTPGIAGSSMCGSTSTLKELLFLLSSPFPIRSKKGCHHLGDFETAEFLEWRLI